MQWDRPLEYIFVDVLCLVAHGFWEMRKTRRFQLGMDRSDGRLAHGSRCVHVVSRTAGQEILFGDQDKDQG